MCRRIETTQFLHNCCDQTEHYNENKSLQLTHLLSIYHSSHQIRSDLFFLQICQVRILKVEYEVEKVKIYTLGKKNVGFTVEVTSDRIVIINNVTKQKKVYSIYELV